MKKIQKLAVLASLLIFAGAVCLPVAPAFALLCFNPSAGVWFDAGKVGKCPTGTTEDPGAVLTPSGTAPPAGGAGTAGLQNISNLIDRAAAALNTIVPFIIGLAVFVILWGIFGYISHAGEEEKRAEARQFVVWGIIGIFFMLSIWGFVNVLDNSFNLRKTAPPRSAMPSLPCIPIPPATTC